MARPSLYPVELRQRAVRMVAESKTDYPSEFAAIDAVVPASPTRGPRPRARRPAAGRRPLRAAAAVRRAAGPDHAAGGRLPRRRLPVPRHPGRDAGPLGRRLRAPGGGHGGQRPGRRGPLPGAEPLPLRQGIAGPRGARRPRAGRRRTGPEPASPPSGPPPPRATRPGSLGAGRSPGQSTPRSLAGSVPRPSSAERWSPASSPSTRRAIVSSSALSSPSGTGPGPGRSGVGSARKMPQR